MPLAKTYNPNEQEKSEMGTKELLARDWAEAMFQVESLDDDISGEVAPATTGHPDSLRFFSTEHQNESLPSQAPMLIFLVVSDIADLDCAHGKVS